MDVIVYSVLDGLSAQLERYRDLSVIIPSRSEQALRLMHASGSPVALYVDDTRSTPLPDLWALIQTAAQARGTVLVNMLGVGRGLLNDARLLGLPTISEGDPASVAAWIARSLGIMEQAQTPRTLPVVAIAAAKGGIGKTFATCLLAEGLRRRGIRVLVWDTDIANPGLVSAFRIPSSAPSYLHLIQDGPGAWNPTTIQAFLYQPEHTAATPDGWGAITFLVGSHAVASVENDVRLPDWQGLYAGVVQLDGYDVLLVDTPPDYLRRPYATHILMSGGMVVLPCPPGKRERMGVGHLLDHFRQFDAQRLDHCALLFLEPERGVTVTVKDVVPLFGSRYPEVTALGTLPRAPRLASLADEDETYISMLDLGPTTVFAQATHRIVDSLIQQIGLTPTLPMPGIGIWAALRGRILRETVHVPAANTSVGALARGEV